MAWGRNGFQLFQRPPGLPDTRVEEVSESNPIPVRIQGLARAGATDLLSALRQQDYLSALALEGRAFYAADADANDMVTGQTSFAATTPTFLLDVPAGTLCIPLFMGLSQSGTVAGGDITLAVEFDRVKRYSSGGTAETVRNARTQGGYANACTLYSGATAVTGYGVRVMGVTLGPDVSPAEGVINEAVWTPSATLDFLVGPASWLVFTYAGTTGPTWLWSFKWIELPTSELP